MRMDMCLLWLPYPLMLVNLAICGFLGSNSAILRSSAVQRYIPERLRSRINALNSVLLTTGASVFSLLMGFLGGKCSTIAGASRSAALPPCWPVIFSSEADGRTFERCTRRAEPIASALCAVFVFGSWIDISKGPSARQSLFVSGFIPTDGGCARPLPVRLPCRTT